MSNDSQHMHIASIWICIHQHHKGIGHSYLQAKHHKLTVPVGGLDLFKQWEVSGDEEELQHYSSSEGEEVDMEAAQNQVVCKQQQQHQ